MKPVLVLYRCALVVAAACTTIVCGSAQPRSAIAQDPAKFLVIDCLLPGQVIGQGRLGRRLLPSRPAKLSATECEIRGGRYVAYDRANYATALAVWLPQAELGDMEAQTYVGEIFEKGLGRPADFELAAQWYTRAAEQGHTRAQLSLAYLYEQGLGVERDPLKALDLYRRATGIEDDGLVYASTLAAVQDEAQSIIDSLTLQLEQQNETVRTLQGELAFTQDKLEQRRRDLAAARAETETLQTQIAEYRRAELTPIRLAELERLENEIKDREQQLTWRLREVAELEADSARQRQELVQNLEAATQRSSALQAQLGESSTVEQALREQLQAAQQALYDNERRVAELTGELSQARVLLTSERERWLQTSAELSTEQQRQLEARESQLTDQERRILALQEAQREQSALIAQLHNQEREQAQRSEAQQQEIQSIRAQLVSAQQRQLDAEQRLADVSAQLRAEQQRINLEREQLARRGAAIDERQRQQIAELTRDLATREARLQEQRALIQTLEEEASFYLQETARLRAQAGTASDGPLLAMRGNERPAAPRIAPSDRLSRDFGLGQYHALIIGNNSYEKLPRLDTALNDAETLERVLREKYGFRTRLLRNATRAEILGALNDYKSRDSDYFLQPEDSLLIYYAGHGELDAGNQVAYWLPVDADRSDNTEWVSDQMITNLIASPTMQARHVLVVADSCYAGAMTRNSSFQLAASSSEPAEMARLKKLAQLPSRNVLTSGDNQPVLDGGGGIHSIFARQLIQALEANDRVLEASRLYETLYAPVTEAALRLQVEQSPRYAELADAGHLSGEFLFVPRT